MTSIKVLFLLLLLILAISAIAFADASDGFDEVEDASSGTNDVYNDPYGDGYGGNNRVSEMAKMAADYDDPYGGYGGPGGAEVSSAKELASAEEIEQFIQEDGDSPVILGYFDGAANKEDLEHFKDLANTEGSKYRFAYTTEKSILESKKYDGCVVVVYPPKNYINEKYERSKHRYPGKSLVTPAFLDFVRFKSLPLAGELNTVSEARYNSLKKPLATIFTAIDRQRNEKGYQYIANRIRKVAKEGSSAGIVFNLANIGEREYDMGADYGISNIDLKKSYVGLRDGNMYYHMSEAFSVEALVDFIKAFKSGKLLGKEKKLHSEEDDEGDDTESAVVKLTGENFKEVVLDSHKDVLLEFYAPWCGHCKHLKPEYRKAAEFFKNDEGVTIAAMDATAHDVPKGFNVEGYPTLIFLPGNNKKKQIPYDGERDARGIVDYINKHRTTKKAESEL